MIKEDPHALQDVWEAVCGSVAMESWFDDISILEGEWDKPGILYVGIEDPTDQDKSIIKNLTAHDLLMAYDALELKGQNQHCGRYDLVDDPDSCSTDLILQQAMLGEIVYG